MVLWLQCRMLYSISIRYAGLKTVSLEFKAFVPDQMHYQKKKPNEKPNQQQAISILIYMKTWTFK